MVKKCSKILTAFFLTLILVFSCSACKADGQKDVTFYPELVQYKLWRSETSTNEFSFNIEVVSSHRNIDIEYVSAEGVNTENMSVTFSDDTFDELNRSINGKYLLLIGVHCLAESDYTKIESMKLNVDGENFELTFPNAIENTFLDDEENEHGLSQLNMPTYIFTTSFVGENETDYSFVVTPTEDITVTGIQFDDFIELSDATVTVNDAELGKIKDVLPLELKKDDVLKVCGKIKRKTNDGLFMGNIYTDLMFHYTFANTQQELTEYYPITAAYVGSKEEAKNFLNAQSA